MYELRHLAAACLHAKERHCNVLAFSRDRDGRRDTQSAIERGIEREEEQPGGLQIIGGVAIEKLESWIIALSGMHRSEQLGPLRIDEALSELGIPQKDTSRYVEGIKFADAAALPNDACSLIRWLEKAKAVLKDASAVDHQ